MLKYLSQYNNKWIFLVILLHISVAIPLGLYVDIWVDEAFTLNTTSKNLSYAVNQAINFEEQPPFYFIVIHFWRNINGSLFFGRLFSTLCIVATIVILSIFCCKIFDGKNILWFISLFALNPYTIYYSIELRCYALVILISSALILLFYNGYLSEHNSYKSRIFYVILAIIGLYTQYYIGYLLLAHAILLLVRKDWTGFKIYLISMVLVAIAFLPAIGFIRSQLSTNVSPSPPYNIFESIERFLSLLVDDMLIAFRYFPPSWLYPLLFRWVVRLTVLSAVLLYLFYNIKFFKNWQYAKGAQINYINILIMSVLFILTIKILAPDSVQNRHLAVLMVPAIIAFTSIFNLKLGTKLQLFIFFVLFFNYSLALMSQYRGFYKNQDWSEVAGYIEDREEAQQPILVFTNLTAIPFTYHYSGINQIIPIPAPFKYEKDWLNNIVLRNEDDIYNNTNKLPEKVKSYWLLMDSWEEYQGVKFNHHILLNYVEKNFRIEQKETLSHGLDVYLLKAK